MFRTLCTTLLALTALASAGAAQSTDDGRIGFGVALNPIAVADFDSEVGVLPIGLGNFTVPIHVGERLRLEPELGIFRVSAEASATGFSSTYNQTVLRYGLGLHVFFGEDGDFKPYVGPRIGFVRHTTEEGSGGSTDFETKRTDSYVGIALGGEYWLASRFSLGAEVQLNRVGIGDEEVTGQPSSGDFDSSVISNNGVIFIRFYP